MRLRGSFPMLDFAALQSLVAHCTDPKRGKFYRRFYGLSGGALHVDSPDDWQKLRPVSKDDLAGSTLRERSFLPLREVDHLRTSSGTSGRAPLFCPRTYVRGMDYRLEYHDFKKPFLAYTVPMMPHWHERFQREHGRCPQVVVYDPAHPAASVRLARIAGVDAFSVFVHHIQPVGEHMRREGMNGWIRFIEITGETCSRAHYEYLRATFPKATILQSYGASEVEDVHIGMPCKPMDGTEPLAVYHPKDSHHLELVDDAGRAIEPKEGVEGDLLITTYPGEPSAFPLIRFRIGDTVRIVRERCARHGTWSFTVVGRTDLDFLKIAGGVLRRDEAERVVRLFGDRISPHFQLHRYERSTPEGPKIQVELHVEPISGTNLGMLADEMAREFRVNPMRTYAAGVTDGLYLPLICVAGAISHGTGKTRALIAH